MPCCKKRLTAFVLDFYLAIEDDELKFELLMDTVTSGQVFDSQNGKWQSGFWVAISLMLDTIVK
jgi:hypothetical protein